MCGYLFTYFTGNHISEEAVRHAVSTDGYTYELCSSFSICKNQFQCAPTGISRNQDGHTFYMVVTDMVSHTWDFEPH